MTIAMKKARIQKQKKAIYKFSSLAFIYLFTICFVLQYHREIIAAVEFVEELF
jgi:hypothetical protein